MSEEHKKKMEVPLKWFLILHLSLIVNSLAGVASKFAGRHDFLSFGFCFYYGLVLLITFVFALVWQQVLKNMSLTFAFTNKPITVIYSLIWGAFVFHENVTPKMVVGALVILAGIVIGVSGNESTQGGQSQTEQSRTGQSGREPFQGGQSQERNMAVPVTENEGMTAQNRGEIND